jgi:PAS domain S-box-containing protein
MKQPGQRETNLSPRENSRVDFVENAVVGLHWVAADGIILWANQSELDLLGYTSEEYISHHIAEFHVDQSLINNILTRLTIGETRTNYEARLCRKDGSIKQASLSCKFRVMDTDSRVMPFRPDQD